MTNRCPSCGRTIDPESGLTVAPGGVGALGALADVRLSLPVVLLLAVLVWFLARKGE